VRNTVVVGEESALAEALALVRTQIADIDGVCSRFRPDSEICRVNRSAGDGETAISQLLEEALVAALQAAAMTDGLVDPTVGKCVEEAGYTVTFGAIPADGPPVELRLREVVGWRSLHLDQASHTIRIPAGVSIDLGASGKAWAADRAADAVAQALGVGVLVECGGDIAVRGEAPADGWPVRVSADVGTREGEDIVLREGGLATSGTTSRRWRRGGVEMHDIVDPRTGLPAATPWDMVTVAAATCLEANAAATAALVMGDRAPSWLERLNLPSRLVRAGGSVRYAGGWAG